MQTNLQLYSTGVIPSPSLCVCHIQSQRCRKRPIRWRWRIARLYCRRTIRSSAPNGEHIHDRSMDRQSWRRGWYKTTRRTELYSTEYPPTAATTIAERSMYLHCSVRWDDSYTSCGGCWPPRRDNVCNDRYNPDMWMNLGIRQQLTQVNTTIQDVNCAFSSAQSVKNSTKLQT